MDMDEDMDRVEREIEKRLRDMEYRKDQVLDVDIQNIQWLCWDFFKAYEWKDRDKCERIVNIMIHISKRKKEIPTLRDYFGKEKISRFYKGTIHLDKASEWIIFIQEKVKGMGSNKVQPEHIN